MKHTTKLLSIIAVTCLLLGLMGCQPTTGNIGCSHSWDVVIDKEANCTENGSKHSVCKYCGEETKPETILAHHTWVVDEKATCTKAGKKYCSACGNANGVEIPALGHNFDNTDTCTHCESYKFWFYISIIKSSEESVEVVIEARVYALIEKTKTVTYGTLNDILNTIDGYEAKDIEFVVIVEDEEISPLEYSGILSSESIDEKIESPIYIILKNK